MPPSLIAIIGTVMLVIAFLNAREIAGLSRLLYVALVLGAGVSAIIAAGYHTGAGALTFGGIAMLAFVVAHLIYLSRKE